MRILVLEDEPLIALDLDTTLQDWGFEVAGPVGSVRQALDILEEGGIGAAVLDVRIGDEDAFEVARILRHSGIPFVLATGCEEIAAPPEFVDTPHLGKPVDRRKLRTWLERNALGAQANG